MMNIFTNPVIWRSQTARLSILWFSVLPCSRLPVAMSSQLRTHTILIADDDPFSCKLVEIALEESPSARTLYTVPNGEEALDYLYRRGKYRDPMRAPRPDLILLDLNMPRKDGWETLREIRQNPTFSGIPVVVMTSSSAKEDVYGSYAMGANSFITKPVSFDGLVRVMNVLSRYWFELVELPQ